MNTDIDQLNIATEAFIYGYPFVYCLDEIGKFPAGTATIVPGRHSFNQFTHARDLAGPETTFVSPNSDTSYSVAALDMSVGPLLLRVPDTRDRYYVIQCVDAWTNNFAYLGRRPTGTAAGSFLLAPWGWEGDVPADVDHVVHVPTDISVLVGRIQVNGPDDLPEVHALQDQFSLQPLAGTTVTGAGIPTPDERVSADLRWWETFRVALSAFPPPDEDAPFVELCRQLGLTATESPFVDPDPSLAEALIAGERAGRAQIEQLLTTAVPPVNGWSSAAHAFDYNRDRLEIGTIDSPEWKIADAKTAYVTRAVAARLGLWGNHGYEADYFISFVDERDEQLVGEHTYELVLPSAPPVGAFWSLTMYDATDFYLVANPIDRYSIGSATPSLRAAADGTITIRMQKDSPGPDLEGNWLPTPAGAFRPVLRMYEPGAEVLDGRYVLPAIRRLT
jgi:hypothetical protein